MKAGIRKLTMVVIWLALGVLRAEPLVLAEGGTTEYSILIAADASVVDRYAADELRMYLGAITDAEFPIVVEGSGAVAGPVISVGDTRLARKRFGADYRAGMKRRDHVMRSDGADIFLYGNGVHGGVQAVIGFLERELGWRWYSVFEHPVTPKQPTVCLEPFHHEHDFSFFRIAIANQRNLDFPYQLGANGRIDQRVESIRSRWGDGPYLDAFVSHMYEPVGTGVHTSHEYLPPTPDHASAKAPGFEWMERKNYFETNPEFYSLNERGQRVYHNAQLDFSNPEMRAELTRNILRHIEVIGKDEILLSVGAEDHPGRFCHCDDCMVLEEQYQSVGGPIYDYLIELCGVLAEKHPGVKVRTLAYRRAQTQRPPVLPEGQRFPDNLIVDFAPIEDNFFSDWNHPDERIQETYADLLGWSQLCDNLWAWQYPVGYGSGSIFPVGEIGRMITNMRKLHEAGVDGIYWDYGGMYNNRSGFTEMLVYLGLKLAQDADLDTDALIIELTDHFYGPAAPLMRLYIAELEEARLAMNPLPNEPSYRSARYDDTVYPYLTPENIHRWQGYFDEMVEIVSREGDERQLLNVFLVRRNLDNATLSRWFDLQDAYPDAYVDHIVVLDRINDVSNAGPLPKTDDFHPSGNRTEYEIARGRSINRISQYRAEGIVRDFAVRIDAGREVKPLPEGVEYTDASVVKQFVPVYPNNRRGRAMILDRDAGLGFAAPVHAPDLPFRAGFYQNDVRKHGARIEIPVEQIVPNTYQLFELGEVEITPICQIWFGRSWATKISLGEQLYEPGAENRWRAYVSVKFVGPTYRGEPDENLVPVGERTPYEGLDPADLVLVDRVILVPLSRSQFAE